MMINDYDYNSLAWQIDRRYGFVPDDMADRGQSVLGMTKEQARVACEVRGIRRVVFCGPGATPD